MAFQQELYKKDFYAWCFQQAALLKDKNYGILDMENIIEELESMGGNQEYQLINRLKQLFIHLLKCKYQPEKRTRSWELSIIDQRDMISFLIYKNPSLKHCFDECVKQAYKFSRTLAAKQTGLSLKNFPTEMPFTSEEALKED